MKSNYTESNDSVGKMTVGGLLVANKKEISADRWVLREYNQSGKSVRFLTTKDL